MKKVIKWTAYILILILAAAVTVCYFVIPTETKQFVDVVIKYLNTPIAIAGVSTTIGGLFASVLVKYILKTTKFGRKELDDMNSKIKKAEEIVENKKSELDAKVTEYENKFAEFQNETQNKVAVVYNEFSELEINLINALRTIPNKKVQEIVSKYETESESRKQEIINKTINTNEYVDAKIAEIKSEYEKSYNELVHKIEVVLNEEAK